MISAIVVIGLVSFVITFFLKELDGPFNVIKRFRDMICVYTDIPIPDGKTFKILEEPTNFWARLFDCFWCLTTWITAVVMLLYLLLIGFPLMWIVFILPASIAVSGSINKFVNL
jgi:hypothetical protein